MNAERLIRMVMRILMRKGMAHLTKGQKQDPNLNRAKQAMRAGRRIGRL